MPRHQRQLQLTAVGYAATNVGTGAFRLAPRVGDRLTSSIYYDQRGHIFFTATDLTQPGTQTVLLYVGRLIYSVECREAGLARRIRRTGQPATPEVCPGHPLDRRVW